MVAPGLSTCVRRLRTWSLVFAACALAVLFSLPDGADAAHNRRGGSGVNHDESAKQFSPKIVKLACDANRDAETIIDYFPSTCVC